MSDRIKSAWRITWDPSGTPLVLLDYGDLMLAEPLIGQPHNSELVSFARALNPEGFHYGNVGHEIQFSRLDLSTDIIGPRNLMMSHLTVTGLLRVATLKIEIEGGDTYHVESSVLKNVSPSLAPENKNFLPWVYNIAGGLLVKI
tara:strand:+ start:913 stop:1344 length:432 start_codon:yes stop_codon:yes gene_type:complete